MKIDDAIEILNKMVLKEHNTGNLNKNILMSKEDLMLFCIKLLKEVKKC